MPSSNRFIRTLDRCMRSRQIGVRALARAAACDPGNLHRILAGRRRVPLPLVAALAEALACTPAEARELADAALEMHGLTWLAGALRQDRAVGDDDDPGMTGRRVDEGLHPAVSLPDHGGILPRMHDADLRLVFWETTAACNLACRHCRRLEEGATADELTTAEATAMIDGIAAVGKPILVFSGGEPLQRRDLWEVAAHARGHGLTLALATNGTQVDDATAIRIREAGFQRVSISIDGADAATHDAFRGQVGSYEAALAGQRRLRAAGVATQINCTVARHNRGQLPALRELCLAIGAEALHLFVVVPVGCGVELCEADRLSAAEVEETLGWLAEQAADPRLFVKATCAPQFYRIIRQRGQLAALRASAAHGHGGKAGMNAVSRGCLAGSAVCFVSAKGEVFPCGYLPLNCGDLRRQDFPSIWRDSLVFEQLRDPENLGGKCGGCAFAGVCGGCRARAYAISGDHLAEEPDCAYQPKRGDRPPRHAPA
jgi:heme b synthase